MDSKPKLLVGSHHSADALALAALLRRALGAELLLLSDRSGIERVAAREQPLAIVLGPSSRGRFGRALAGGTTERLLAHSEYTLAIAPAGFARGRRRSLATIGCAFDGSYRSRRAAMLSAQLARAASARLVLIGVHERPSFAEASIGGALGVYTSANSVLREELRGALDRAVSELGRGTDADAVLRQGTPRRTLAELSDELDLLVCGTPGQYRPRPLRAGSVSSGLLHDARCPLLLVPERAAPTASLQRTGDYALVP